MDPTTRKVLLSSSKKASEVFVDDVFSTFLYEGTGSAQTITNGIDLSGEGGLVWLKSRGNNYGSRLVDTERGATKALESYDITAEATESTGLTAFTNTGFTVGTKDHYNGNGFEMCAWTFRKCPGFFDIVTWTGNGTSGNYTRQIAHNLGSVPGFILIKRTNTNEYWQAYHRSLGNNSLLLFGESDDVFSPNTSWNTTSPTSTHFTVNSSSTNGAGGTFVAYIFAHQPNTSFVEEVYVQDYYANGSNISGPNGTGEYRFFYNSNLNNTYATVGPNSYQVSGQNKWDELSDVIFAALGQRYRVGNLQSSGTVNFYSMEYFTGYTGPTYDDEEVYSVCGSYRGTGASGNEIVLGFEPQWVLIKQTNGSKDWMMFDNMRGIVDGQDDALLEANKSNAEFTKSLMALTPTGFRFTSSDSDVNGSNDSYVYIAIRRPNKPPSAGTDVFAVDTRGSTGDGKAPTYRAPFPVDMQFHRNVNYTGGGTPISARLTQGRAMHPYLNGAEFASASQTFDYNNGFQDNTGIGPDQYAWMFKRAPGFFDVVTYEGTGSARLIKHNLGVVPQLMIVKRRDSTGLWYVYSSITGASKYLTLNNNAGDASSGTGAFWNNTAPTSTVFSIGTFHAVNNSGGDFLNYLFSSLDGISKIGSYTGTGYNINIDCGFTAGSRFVMIKRTDTSGDWYIYDSLRGIVNGNDPYVLLNSGNAQVTNTDYIDPLSTGFTVTSSAPAALNASGGTYLFLAIA